jgi:hypothetical protein
MNKCVKALIPLVLSLAVCFVCVGYAQVFDTLTVTGHAEAEAPETLYISSVGYASKGAGVKSETNGFRFPTTVETTAVMSTGSTSNRSVTYEIVVVNNTRYKYSFKGIECVTPAGETNDNNLYLSNSSYSQYGSGFTVYTKNNVNDTTSTFKEGTTVEPNTTVKFYATYQFTRNVPSEKELSFLLNYKFGIHVDSFGDMALDRVLIKFDDVLNTESTYKDLITHIDDKFQNQEWQSNYMGNVTGADNDDTKTIERLFGDQLSLTIDGVTKNITLLIKRENIDGNTATGDRYGVTYPGNRNPTYYSGCEMTLYMTANDLDRTPEAGEYNSRTQADVYIAIFTCQADSNGNPVGGWYQIGDVYKGIAPISSYSGDRNQPGSFVTDDWLSLNQTYRVTSNYSYSIANNVSIKNIIPTTDRNARNEYNRLLSLARSQIEYIDQNADYFNEEAFAQPIARLRETYQKASSMTVNNSTYRINLIQILKELENVTYPFLTYVD